MRSLVQAAAAQRDADREASLEERAHEGQQWRVCKVAGCGRQLGRHNRSGVCTRCRSEGRYNRPAGPLCARCGGRTGSENRRGLCRECRKTHALVTVGGVTRVCPLARVG